LSESHPGRRRPEAVQGKLNAANERVLTKLSLLFHDLRGGLVSLQAALKLSRRLAQGQHDADVDRLLEDAGQKADGLQALLEGFLRQAFRRRESDAEPDLCHIREDVVARSWMNSGTTYRSMASPWRITWISCLPTWDASRATSWP